MKRYFITGTDTDCGKTYVTQQLLSYYPNSIAIKPVGSGLNTELLLEDALALKKYSNVTMDLINPWRFKSPISPHIAAQEEGVQLSAQSIANYCLEFDFPHADRLFIEGAGGLLVPLNQKETWVDFLIYSKIPVVLIVGMRLGCLNHALLTSEVMMMKGIQCIGWIANCIDPEMIALSANINTLMNKLEFPLLETIPHSGSITCERIL